MLFIEGTDHGVCFECGALHTPGLVDVCLHYLLDHEEVTCDWLMPDGRKCGKPAQEWDSKTDLCQEHATHIDRQIGEAEKCHQVRDVQMRDVQNRRRESDVSQSL